MSFYYRDGRLQVGDGSASAVEVKELLRGIEGPAYVYDLKHIVDRFHLFKDALSGKRNTIHYAMKANSNKQILKTLAELGAGVDTVSGGEVRLALEAGLPAERIIFSGVAKTKSEIRFAIKNQIKQINVESPQELVRIAEIATEMGRSMDVAFRMNPDVNPQTHPYITTGFRENKFGMDESFVPELLAILKAHPKQLKLRGLTQHIGSLLFDLGVMREAIEKTLRIHQIFVKEGFDLDRLDVGGGLGIRYETADEAEETELIRAYGKMVSEVTASIDVEILTEPGRILVGRAGLLVGEVQYIKKAPAKTFAILDTGMHHLLRPALYGSRHRVLPLVDRGGPTFKYDIAGPICESSDIIARDVELTELRSGDLVGIADAGAYGYVMASQYNAHALPHEVITGEHASTTKV